MFRALRQVVILLTLLSLAVFPVARSVAAADATRMEICAEAGAQVIWLDADGTPVEAPVKCCTCPDCMIEVAACLPDVVSAPQVIGLEMRQLHLPAPQPRPILAWLIPQSRGPPFLQDQADMRAPFQGRPT